MSSNPYAPPTAAVADVSSELEYAGFWIRLGAALIDTVLIIAITYPLLYAIYGAQHFSESKASFISGPAEVLISWVLPAVASILFWRSKQATPGKMALSLKVVDARTGKALSFGQSVARYLGYFVSSVPLCLGFFWIGFDARKQGWHDKIGGSVVIRSKVSTTRPVTFEDA
jgi:uncharacterized RDD family membrane protein YckC